MPHPAAYVNEISYTFGKIFATIGRNSPDSIPLVKLSFSNFRPEPTKGKRVMLGCCGGVGSCPENPNTPLIFRLCEQLTLGLLFCSQMQGGALCADTVSTGRSRAVVLTMQI